MPTAKLALDQEDIESAITQFMALIDDDTWPGFAERFDAEVLKAKIESVPPSRTKKFRKIHSDSFKDDPWYKTKFKTEEPGDLEASIVIEFDGDCYVLDGQHRLNRAIKNDQPADVAFVQGDWMKDFGITKEILNNKFHVHSAVMEKDQLFNAFQRLLRGDPSPKAPKNTNYTPDQIRDFSASNRVRWLGFTPGRPALEPAMSSLIRALERVVGQNPGHCQFYPYGVPKGAEGPAEPTPLPEIPCTEEEKDDDEDSEVVLP